MSYKTDNALFHLKKEGIKYSFSFNESERQITPIEWYIMTGRISGYRERVFQQLSVRRLNALAKKLFMLPQFGDYQLYIDCFNEYIDSAIKAEERKTQC